MENHQYKGTLICCLTCFRPESDPIHTLGTLCARHKCGKCGKYWQHEYTCGVNVAELICQDCVALPEPVSLFPAIDAAASITSTEERINVEDFEVFQTPTDNDPGEVPEDRTREEIIASTLDPKQDFHSTATVNCSGHVCPSCNKSWQHDYICNGKYTNGLCHACASQAGVDISRPITIEQIAQTSSKNLTGQEVAELMLDHEEFVVWNLIYDKNDPEHKEFPDWQERINIHRRDLKRKIEQFRVRELATGKAVLRKQAEDMTKLTPEEIEQYKRDAAKKAAGKKTKSDATASAAKIQDPKAAYEKLLKGLMSDIKAKRPDLEEKDIMARAEKRYKLQLEMEAE